MIGTRLRKWILAGVAVSMTGCAATGAQFVPFEPIPDEQALVYIYRGKSLYGGAITYHVAEGDRKIVYLKRGGYYPYLTEPGTKTFWARTEATSEVTKDLHPGETYYLRGRIVQGVGIGRPSLEFIDPVTGAEHLRNMRLLPSADGPAN